MEYPRGGASDRRDVFEQDVKRTPAKTTSRFASVSGDFRISSIFFMGSLDAIIA
jgi:hypothetical protein